MAGYSGPQLRPSGQGGGAPTVGTTWEKVFDFGDKVDSKFLVELSDEHSDDPVGVEMYIAINDERVQKATKFITRSNTMELAVKRPWRIAGVIASCSCLSAQEAT